MWVNSHKFSRCDQWPVFKIDGFCYTEIVGWVIKMGLVLVFQFSFEQLYCCLLLVSKSHGLVTFLWSKPPPTDELVLQSIRQNLSSQWSKQKISLWTIHQWRLYFIWSINLFQNIYSLSLTVILNPGLGHFAWPNLSNLNSFSISSHVTLIMGDWRSRFIRS